MVTGPIAQDEVPQIKRSRWADNFFRPLLITIMIMCFNISLVNLVRLFNPAWRGTYFLIGMLLTTVEAIYSYRVLRSWRSRGISILRYRIGEWTVLFLMLRILSFAGKPIPRIWAELQLIWQDPFNNFITIEFFILWMLAFIAWLVATNTMADFEELHDPPFRWNNTLPLDNLATRFFWGGIILVLISGITQWILRAGLPILTDFQRPSLGGIIFNVLVYFTLGLVLLSQAHLTSLLVRWKIQKITVASDLVKQWAKYGFLFLGLITLVAFFLPTNYTLGFLASAAIVIRYLLAILMFIYELLLLLIFLPFVWLLSLLGQSPEMPAPAPIQPPLFPESAPEARPTIPWLEAIRSLIFWLVALAMIWYLVKIYLNDHPELTELLTSFKPVGFMINLLKQLWQQLRRLVRMGVGMIPKKVTLSEPEGETVASTRQWSWFGLRGLPPRQRILQYYLNILKRAESGGPVRKTGQTPYEYEPNLSQVVPDAQMEVKALTQIFVRARYSRENFDEEQVTRVKGQWQQIRQALKNLRKRRQRPEEP